MGAGFQGDIERGAAALFAHVSAPGGARRAERLDLGMRPAHRAVPAFADDRRRAHEDGAHHRVGRGAVAARAGEPQGEPEYFSGAGSSPGARAFASSSSRGGQRRTPAARKSTRSSAFSPTPRKQHRQAQLAGDGHRHPALGRAVELGEQHAVDRHRLAELRACASAFCPVVASSTSIVSCGQPAASRSITRRTLSSSAIRFSWCAGARRCRRSARRAFPGARRVDRVVDHRRRDRRRLALADDVDPEAVGPERRAARSAAARKVSPAASITCWPSSLSSACELGDRGGLADAVDPHHERARPRAERLLLRRPFAQQLRSLRRAGRASRQRTRPSSVVFRTPRPARASLDPQIGARSGSLPGIRASSHRAPCPPTAAPTRR